MPIHLGGPGSVQASPAEPPLRRSKFGNTIRGIGRLVATPFVWMGPQRIVQSASFIGDLTAAIRTRHRRDSRFKTEGDGGFDLHATAFSYGLTVIELEARLARRRLQTARIAYTTLALASVFLVAWIWRALSSPLTGTRIGSALEFLPFCALFFLLAFYNALLNFQIRIRRAAAWREYLTTDQPFWPR
jgi:hypothetical protein